MKEMKMTDWYPGSVKPVRVGWYDVKLVINIARGYWNGKLWTWGPGRIRFKHQFREWRGLAEKQQ